MSDFDAIIKGIEKVAAKDPNMSIHSSGDLNLKSRAPYGIPTGLPLLDFQLGRPGLPAGKVIEYFGFEKSGKTTAALHAIAEAQHMGGAGLFIDSEMSFDRSRAEQCGVNTEINFAVGEADTIEGIFRQLEATAESLIATGWNKPFVVMVDSVTAVQSETNKNKEIGEEPRVGEDARVIRHGMRRLVSKFAEANMTVIFINHAISAIASGPFAPQSTSAGGHAIKFFASVRINFSSGSNIMKQVNGDKQRIGQKVFLRIEKLKGSPLVFPQLEQQLTNDTGFNYLQSLLDASVKSGLISISSDKKLYKLKTGEEQTVDFPKTGWKETVDGLGGPKKFYSMWMDWCINEGLILKWNEF